MGTYPLKEKPGTATLAHPRASQWGLTSLQGQEENKQENNHQQLQWPTQPKPIANSQKLCLEFLKLG